jgi:3-methylcrotonyl-CoA carboxylase alpha subunit
VQAGDSVSPFYDSMIAKVIEHGVDRPSALRQLARQLDNFPVAGVKTNVGFLVNLLRHVDVQAGQMDTGLIARDIATLIDQRVSMAMVSRALTTAAFAATERAGCLSNGDEPSRDPWAMNDTFQLGGNSHRPMTLVIDNEPITVKVRWDGGPQGGPSHPVVSHPNVAGIDIDEDEFEQRSIRVGLDGTIYGFERGRQIVICWPTYDPSAIEDTGDGTSIRAPINGRVAKIFVAPGDTIDKGQRIAVVEAMKMEHILSATAAGMIDKVPVSEGAQVVQGALIASLTVA